MERKIIQGKEYVFEKVMVEGTAITLLGVVSNTDHNLVEFNTYRPNDLIIGNGQMSTTKPIKEFMEELKFMTTYMSNHGLNGNSFTQAFLSLCEDHVTKFNRLIDQDLYAYVDQAVILLNSLLSAQGSELGVDGAKSSWKDLLGFALKEFSSDIFETKYDFSNPLEPRPYLEKLVRV